MLSDDWIARQSDDEGRASEERELGKQFTNGYERAVHEIAEWLAAYEVTAATTLVPMLRTGDWKSDLARIRRLEDAPLEQQREGDEREAEPA